MLTELAFKQIKSELTKGKEVEIFCNSLDRAVEIEKHTFNFSGKLKIKLFKVRKTKLLEVKDA